MHRTDPWERFWDKVNIGPVPAHRPDLGACLRWTAAVNEHGYPTFRAETSGDARVYAHKWAWEQIAGRPVRRGYRLDHVCHDWTTCPGGRADLCRRCVAPLHLEEITARDNVVTRSRGIAARNARKTLCVHGHPLTAGNVRIHPTRGTRDCRTCHRLRAAGLLPGAVEQLALSFAG